MRKSRVARLATAVGRTLTCGLPDAISPIVIVVVVVSPPIVIVVVVVVVAPEKQVSARADCFRTGLHFIKNCDSESWVVFWYHIYIPTGTQRSAGIIFRRCLKQVVLMQADFCEVFFTSSFCWEEEGEEGGEEERERGCRNHPC